MAPIQTGKEKFREFSESAPYLFYKDRLSSFKKFAYDKDKNANCTSEKVARAGFHFTGPESGKCPFCRKELEFDAEDDPWEEHKSRRPDCVFVQIGKLEENTLTVEEVIRLAVRHIDLAKLEQRISIVDEWAENVEPTQLVKNLKKLETSAKKSSSDAPRRGRPAKKP